MKNLKMIFIVGAPRSGTTWLQSMLAFHPRIVTGQETHFFKAIDNFLSFYSSRNYPRKVGLFAYWPKDRVYFLLRDYFLKFIEPIMENYSKDPIFFLEKTPEHTLYLDLIYKCFPDAKFIHIIRDARHVVSSLLRIPKKGKFEISVTTAALLWKDFVVKAKKFGCSHSSQYYEIKYEVLRKDTFNNLKHLFSWLQLDISDDLLKKIIYETSLKKVKKTKSFATIKTIDSNSLEPDWFVGPASISNQKFNLSSLQLFKIYDICGKVLYELGYISTIPKVPFWAKIATSYKVRKVLRLKQI